ncbi:MAG: TonB-dependent receptor [Paludibacteraceae bacterium]|nr:TonB-dependent receptor [Paludibacteraceae bacterium]
MKRIVLFLVAVFAVMAMEAAVVKGKIVDAGGSALDFVNVMLTSKSDKSAVYGAISDETGHFEVMNVPAGEYELDITFVGYQTIKRDVSVKSLSDQVALGRLVLREDAKMLGEVEVVGQASQMRFDIDKKVFNVDQNLAASGASASEMLQGIPSVDVDNEGNISLRNSSSVEVWINGKPSGLTEENRAQILEQMPAGSIEAVEVITNPSAKFNPEGTAGIINLVLKKDRKAGYYGSVSAGGMYNIGSPAPGAHVGANFNYNSSLVDFYVNLGARYMSHESDNVTDRYSFERLPLDSYEDVREQWGDTLSYLNTLSASRRSFLGLFGRMGADFHITKKSTIGISVMGHGGTNNSKNLNTYTREDWATMDTIIYERENQQAGMRPSYSVSLDYAYEIDPKGSEVRTSIEYSGHNRSGDYLYKQRALQGYSPEYTQIQRQNGHNQNVNYKLDYTQKIGQTQKVEVGLYGSWQQRLAPSRAWNLLDGEEGPDGSTIYYNSLLIQFNDFNYEEWIAAMYATYGAKFGPFSMSLGLRGEYTNTFVRTRDVEEESAWQENRRGYFQVYPTAFLSYAFPNNHELQANYTRRINRPRGRQINSFRDMSDSTNISFGNPLLDPEISSAVELNYLKTWDDHAISAGLYYRFSDNAIERVRYLDDNVMYSTFENVSRRQSAGLEVVAKNKVTKWLNLTTTVNCYYAAMDSVFYDTNLDGELDLLYPFQQSFSWNARLMANFLIPMGWSAQLTGMYRSADVVAQGKMNSQYVVDLGVRKSFLDRKLNLAISVRDLLNSRRWASTTWGDNFWQYSSHEPRGTMFSVTLTYNFGNMRAKKQRPQSGGMDMGGEGMDEGLDF